MKKTDALIRKFVAEQLRWDSRIGLAKIKVSVKNGDVTLAGTVPNYYAKGAALKDVVKIGGYRLIINKLKIKPLKEFIDEEIKENVERALFWNLLLDENDIKVTVKEGVVTLKGVVLFYWQKESVENSASVNGVIDIINKIAVVPTRNIADEDIAKDIIKAMERDGQLEVNNINVKVIDRKVTLTGQVPSRLAYESATENALYTWGVIDLVNKLEIII